MKKTLILAAVVLLSASCFHFNGNFDFSKGSAIKGEGPVLTKDMDLTGFDAIHVEGGADVVFSQAADWAVSVTTQENVFDSLDYEVVDSVLVIKIKNHRNVRAEEYKLAIQSPSLRRLDVDGATDFKVHTPLTLADDFEVQVNGAGDLEFTAGITCKALSFGVNGAADLDANGLNVESLKIQINGAGDVTVSGKAGSASLEVNGAGDIDARELEVAGEVQKRASGAARVRM